MSVKPEKKDGEEKNEEQTTTTKQEHQEQEPTEAWQQQPGRHTAGENVLSPGPVFPLWLWVGLRTAAVSLLSAPVSLSCIS